MFPPYLIKAGIENPAFMPDMDSPTHSPPWLMETEMDMAVAPSQRAQRRLPWTPNRLRRLAPMRISTCSTDSFLMADVSLTLEEHDEQPQGDNDEMWEHIHLFTNTYLKKYRCIVTDHVYFWLQTTRLWIDTTGQLGGMSQSTSRLDCSCSYRLQ